MGMWPLPQKWITLKLTAHFLPFPVQHLVVHTRYDTLGWRLELSPDIYSILTFLTTSLMMFKLNYSRKFLFSFILHFRPLGTFLVFTKKLKFCHYFYIYFWE